jgi:hypothetical protein
MKKNRGRPPNEQTMARRKAETVLSQVSVKMTAKERRETETMIRNGEKIEQLLRSPFKGCRNLSHKLRDQLSSESLDEGMTESEWSRITSEFKTVLEKTKKAREDGGRIVHERVVEAATLLCQKNNVLIKKIRPRGRFSLRQVAALIRTHWNKLPNELRQAGEECLTARGVQGFGWSPDHIPSIRTIERYVKLGLPLHFVRQTS